MMIVGARSYWSIVKLLVCMLVFLGLNLLSSSYAIECIYPEVDNWKWRCITPIKTIDSKEIEELTISCSLNPNQLRCNTIDPITWKPYKDTIDPNKYTEYMDCLIKNPWNTQKCTEIKNQTSLGKCLKKWYSQWYCDCKEAKWIYLNTEVPFVWAPNNPRCLVLDGTWWWATTVLQSLTKILMTFVMIGGFGMIVWWGVQIAAGDVKWGKEKIIWVVIAFALLWSLWVILRFINPNFFS